MTYQQPLEQRPGSHLPDQTVPTTSEKEATSGLPTSKAGLENETLLQIIDEEVKRTDQNIPAAEREAVEVPKINTEDALILTPPKPTSYHLKTVQSLEAKLCPGIEQDEGGAIATAIQAVNAEIEQSD